MARGDGGQSSPRCQVMKRLFFLRHWGDVAARCLRRMTKQALLAYLDCRMKNNSLLFEATLSAVLRDSGPQARGSDISWIGDNAKERRPGVSAVV